jgi:LmbE family N-acetylglucosaminyl deacetylase
LRLSREKNWQIVNVAVTLGSNLARRQGRRAELAHACTALGFDCALPQEDGFSNVNAAARADEVEAWLKMTTRLAELIAFYHPDAVFLPHGGDWNATHVGTHLLGMDALTAQGKDFSCAVIQTEYWHPNPDPNVMIEASESEAAILLSGQACYTGENTRNAFDASFPAYLTDNVRRGSELMGGKGAAAAPMDFAMLYQFGLWRGGKFLPSALKRFLATGDDVGALFE